jgi:hypothetical protein
VARLRRRESLNGSAGIPEALLDPQHRVWLSAGSVARWCEQNLITIARRDIGPLDNQHQAAIAYALASGLVRVLPSGVPWPDWAALRAEGIPVSSSARSVERLEHAGVTVTFAKRV